MQGISHKLRLIAVKLQNLLPSNSAKVASPTNSDTDGHTTVVNPGSYKSCLEARGVIPTSEEFLTGLCSLDQMPSLFSFTRDEIRFGLVALSKWAEEAGGKETAGVIFGDDNAMRFKDITVGTQFGVSIEIRNLSQLDPASVERNLNHIIAFQQKKDHRVFVLLPKGVRRIDALDQKIITENGTAIYGSIHVHPSGNPPNGQDLAILLFQHEEFMKGVIAGGKHYVMVRSKDSPSFETEPTKDLSSTTRHDFGKKIDFETDHLQSSGISESVAIMQSLVKYCKSNFVALYEGDLKTNIYKKIV